MGDGVDYSIELRPHSRDSAVADEERRQRARAFAPKMPNKNRPVERVQFASASASSTAEGMLKDAYRRQTNEEINTRQANVLPERHQGVSLPTGSNFKGPGTAGSEARKVKEKQAGKSVDVRDLAFNSGRGKKLGSDGNWHKSYAPISVPYYDVKQQEDAVASGGNAAAVDTQPDKQRSRPKMVQVDEANANAAKQLFLDENDQLVEGQIIFIQLPACLPELQDPDDEVRRDGGDEDKTLNRLPDGILGKLRIHKSGKVRLDVSGVPFCVDQGCETYFQQDLVCVCPLANEMVNVGPIKQRMVVTPDIDEMLARSKSG
mmetsp:Transcript_23673/g.55223  ORF Transcript_23673/g.55223 Transcript_23673/m.55223 type:complete len:318 (-) Transcript_23673:132-1085(-)